MLNELRENFYHVVEKLSGIKVLNRMEIVVWRLASKNGTVCGTTRGF